MLEIKKINETLKFLELKNQVKFQFQLLEYESTIKKNDNFEVDDYKFCKSSVHNTNSLICLYFYKKTF